MPGEIGGVLFTFNLVVAVASPFVALHLFFGDNGKDNYNVNDYDNVNVDVNHHGIDQKTMWTLALALSGTWFVTFAIFLCLMKNDQYPYWKSFFSFTTGHEWVLSVFSKSDFDEQKAGIVQCNKRHWIEIRDDVKLFFLQVSL